MDYIVIDRDMMRRPLFDNPSVRCLWLNLLLLADWDTGQVPYGERTLAELSGIGYKAVRLALKKLSSEGLITIGKGAVGAHIGAHIGAHFGNLVTIYDYDSYKFSKKGEGALRGADEGAVRAHFDTDFEQFNDLPFLYVGPTNNSTVLQEEEKELISSIPNNPPDILNNISAPPSGFPPADKKKIPPRIEWVIAYCEQRQKGVDPYEWFDHYKANGWKVGKTRMVDWQAAVRTWERKRATNKVGNRGNQDDDYRRIAEQMQRNFENNSYGSEEGFNEIPDEQ